MSWSEGTAGIRQIGLGFEGSGSVGGRWIGYPDGKPEGKAVKPGYGAPVGKKPVGSTPVPLAGLRVGKGEPVCLGRLEDFKVLPKILLTGATGPLPYSSALEARAIEATPSMKGVR